MEDNNSIYTEKECTCERAAKLVNAIATKLGDGFDVTCASVQKNNSVMLDGITIREKGRIVAPTIYLNDLFDGEDDEENEDDIIDRIADGIVESYESWMIGTQDLNPEFFTFENMKDRIILRMVNYEMNAKMLETTPHLKYKDLAVYFCCLVKVDSQGLGTVRITDSIVEDWKVSVEELKELAMVNTPKLLPYDFNSMYSVLARMLAHEIEMHPENCDIARMRELLTYLESGSDTKLSSSMFVLTTQAGINGATCLLYDGVAEEIAKRLGTGYYILPSSVNEVIIIPDTAEIAEEYLRAMVPEVNHTEVDPTEVLSNEIYRYPRDGFKL